MDFSRIKLVATDVDGVLTNGRIFYGDVGKQGKFFSVRDGFAFKLLKLAGLRSVIITGKKTGIVKSRFSDVQVDSIYENIDDKMAVIKKICRKECMTMEEICYIGDDILDMDVLKSVGFSVAPRDADEEVKKIVMYVTSRKSGEGAFRECVEIILKGQRKWQKVLERLSQF
ncbi:MAG TPA: HAD hydrolase family protein [bacterium]|nr:HAD hydrolase family protein [bacterium]HOL35751.1 HAD hydrolase family protein [bacterium]HPP07840.1 HAD hydrolase family protein [bacterium]